MAGAAFVAVGFVPVVRGDRARLGEQREEVEPVPPLWRAPREGTGRGWEPKGKVTLGESGEGGPR